MRSILGIYMALATFVCVAQGVPESDKKFAMEAAEGGLLETQLGELAQRNGYTPAVKTCGRRMVEDHSKANEELKEIATKKNISLPDVLGHKKKEKYQDLSKLTGKTFDRAYAKYMVRDHKKDIAAFKKEAKKGSDPDLKNWAAEKVSTLESHLEMWQKALEEAEKKN